jgi:ABC-type uncharacterized transport system ATPase subunit
LETLSSVEGVQRVGLAGDHLRTISQDMQAVNLEHTLRAAGIHVQRIERGEPTLEDVFITLAKD